PHLLLTPRRDIQFPSPYREASVTKISQCMPLNDGIIETITTRGRARSPHEATARSCPATRATGGPEYIYRNPLFGFSFLSTMELLAWNDKLEEGRRANHGPALGEGCRDLAR